MEERLRKFEHLVDAGNFTKAAALLHVSQPALSAAIVKLERELKAKLLVRGVRPLALTSAGRLAYQAAKDLAVHADNLRLRLAELADQPVTLRIGMIDSVADALFASSNSLSMLDRPKVSVVVNNSRYLVDAVERGKLDIAYIAEQQKKLPTLLEASLVAVEPLVVVVHATLPSVSGNNLPNFISYDQPSNTFRLVQQALREYGLTADVSFYSTSPEVMLRLVMLGKGVAVLPYRMVRPYIQTGELRRLSGVQPWLIKRNIVAVKRRDKVLPTTLSEVTAQTGMVLQGLTADANQ